MWQKLKAWFKDFEVIVFARLQMLLGAMLTVLVATDLSPLFATGMPSTQQLAIAGIVFAQGVATEVLRRRRAEDM